MTRTLDHPRGNVARRDVDSTLSQIERIDPRSTVEFQDGVTCCENAIQIAPHLLPHHLSDQCMGKVIVISLGSIVPILL
jgi:hypothetical protein